MKKICFFLLLPIVFTAGLGCRKSNDPAPETVFVKLFPADSSYKTGGCFQLKDGNYVIYGFDPDNGGILPLVIKTDQKGKIIWQRKLPSQFHYLTIKATSDGNMLAVGVNTTPATKEYVCKIYSNDSIGAIWEYEIDEVRVTNNISPDLVETPTGFIITGFVKIAGPTKAKPFILHIDHEGNQVEPLITYSLSKDTALNTNSICSNGNGYSICGAATYKDLPYKGFFYLKVDLQFNEIWDTIIFDRGTSLNAYTLCEENSGNSTIVCGSSEGTALSGKVFTLKVDSNWNWADTSFYNDYENLGRLTSICKTNDGGYIVLGTVNLFSDINSVSTAKIYLLKLDANLNKEWSREFNSSHSYTSVAVNQTFDGGYLIGGYDHTASFIYTMMMIKTDASGNIVQENLF